jgi:hypothetical protein
MRTRDGITPKLDSDLFHLSISPHYILYTNKMKFSIFFSCIILALILSTANATPMIPKTQTVQLSKRGFFKSLLKWIGFGFGAGAGSAAGSKVVNDIADKHEKNKAEKETKEKEGQESSKTEGDCSITASERLELVQ